MKKEFFYDPRGNETMVVTPTETTRYFYDYRNRLIAVEDGTNRTEYVYDGNGDRATKIVNGERTTYVNDPNQEFTQAFERVPVEHRARVIVVTSDGERLVGEAGGDQDDQWPVRRRDHR